MGDIMLLWLVPFLILNTILLLLGYIEFNSDESSAIKRIIRTFFMIFASAAYGPFLWLGFPLFCWNVKRFEKRYDVQLLGEKVINAKS